MRGYKGIDKGDITLIALTMALLVPLVYLADSGQNPEIADDSEPEHPLNIRHNIDGPLKYILKSNESTWIDEGVRGTEIPAYYVETNSKGLREEKFSSEPPENTTRILVIGDSYTYGWGINRSERFTDRFERSLNTDYRQNFQVLNAGIPGTGMHDFYLFLRERGVSYSPDYVVVPFQKGDSISTVDTDRLKAEAKSRMPENSTRQEVREKIEEIKKQRYENKPLENSSLTREMLEIDSIARKNGIKPVFYLTRPLDNKDKAFIKNWETENDIILFYPPKEMHENPGSRYEISPKDVHYNSEGHKVLYRKFYNRFTSKYLEEAK